MAPSKIQSSIGSRTTIQKNDFYPTPEYVTEALFERETFTGNVWECASGGGHMSRVVERHNICFSSDLREGGDVYGETGVDFLASNKICDNLITNPPFKLAEDFLCHAKTLTNHKIALILRLSFLEGQKRKIMFSDKTYPLKKVYVFSKRVSFQESALKQTGGMMAFAWFVWEKTYVGEPTISWI